MSSNQTSKPLWIFFAALLLVATGVAAFVGLSVGPQAELPTLGEVPDVTFLSATESEFGFYDLKGRVWVGDLMFTSCAGPCLRMTSQMYRLQEAFKDDERFALLSISVDPDRDTPERLTWYANQTLADERWAFVTADKNTIQDVAIKGLKLVVDHNVEGEPFGILHSDRFVLVDARGYIRGYYDGLDPESIDRLAADAKKLLSSL